MWKQLPFLHERITVGNIWMASLRHHTRYITCPPKWLTPSKWPNHLPWLTVCQVHLTKMLRKKQLSDSLYHIFQCLQDIMLYSHENYWKLTMHLTSQPKLPPPTPFRSLSPVQPAESSRNCEESRAVPGATLFLGWSFTMVKSKGKKQIRWEYHSLVGGIPIPLKKIWVRQLGWLYIPNWMEIH